jgi:DNA mismatch endonuclease, patch repair protein
MVDTVSRQARSELMARVRSRDTGPELRVRSLVHGLGYRFVTCGKALPGTPDLVFTARKKAIFVHGCFWHGHRDCRLAMIPKTRTAFWRSKISLNRVRDTRVQCALTELGWSTLVVWQCDLTAPPDLIRRITKFLGPQRASGRSRKTSSLRM